MRAIGASSTRGADAEPPITLPAASATVAAYLACMATWRIAGLGADGHYRDILERIVLPELGTRQGEKVTTADLARLHVRLKNTPYQANRMLAVVGSLYAFAAKRKLAPAGFSPARGIDRYPEKGRERFLTGEELAKLGDAIREAETVGLPWGIDRTKPTAKHAPKEANRRTVVDPFAAAAIRLLIS
jgi:hypothetical protein